MHGIGYLQLTESAKEGWGWRKLTTEEKFNWYCNQVEKIMKNLFALVITVVLVGSPMAFAGKNGSNGSYDQGSNSSSASVPELDAGAAVMGLGLVLGLGALVRERSNRD